MIIFKTLSWRNFLSTGNDPTTVLLDKASSTLIIGTNGAGKSTILDALTFALFGKPFRNINKPSLCNSINNKNCIVEITFDIGTSEYKIIRGIKPGIFEIWLNGSMMNQDAAVKDYQKLLEQQILRLNYKTFTQVVILGSASFVPFMQLPAWQRREVIEDILDIGVFSTMNSILKERINETKDQLQSIDTKITQAKNSVESQKKLIGTLVNSKRDQVAQIRKQIQDNETEIASNEKRWEVLNDQMNGIMAASDNGKELEDMIAAAIKAKSKFTHMKEQTEKNLSFFQDNETCPSCSQGIPHEHKTNIISTLNEDNKEIESNMSIIEDAYSKLFDRQTKLNEINKQLLTLNSQCNAIFAADSIMIKQNKKLQLQIESAAQDTVNIDEEKKKLKDIADNALILIDKKNELSSERNVQEVASLLLKDTGIKTAIIKEYLPVMNKLINGYLTAMDFYVHFELDESFNEVIKSRFRDEFTYASFSEGEKQKIDLALLFAWRKIAKLKNSVNTNLLIMDEVFDSSLDANSTDLLLDIINTIDKDANIFVISHKGDQLFDKFRSVIKFVKNNDYSEIEMYK
jgi:DNA repair exonuclease SbcCD ATPase subunit